jgi:tetratricopeptide (TPR) repeat protein
MGKTLLGIIVGYCMTVAIAFADTNSTPSEQGLAWQQHVIQTYQSLQEQQQATQRAVEQARQEAEAAGKRNAEALETGLKRIEQGLNAQREREIESLQNSHRFALTLVGVIAGAGFLGMLVVALFLLRAMNRRVAMMAPAMMAENSLSLTPVDPVRQSNARLRASLDRLENRLTELETTTQSTESELAEEVRPVADIAGRIALLLGKGQALLNLQQADRALTCFEEAIALDPTNGEAFVKMGTALEKLGRLDEAIDCYDRAIAVDTSMTMAYLCKGGVFNRLERYSEALQCYEQALRAQQKSGIA